MRKLELIAILTGATLVAACSKQGVNDFPEVQVDGQVETYSYASTVKPSTKFVVKVNSETQRVVTTPEQHICLFGCDGTVEVKIASPAVKITSVAVRPVSKNPVYRLDGDTLTLYMGPKDRYDVELNGSTEMPLFLFANPLGKDIEPKGDNVLRFEAGKVHEAGRIVPVDGQSIYIEGGAIVYGSIEYFATDNTKGVEICGGGILHDKDDGTRSGSAMSAVRISKADNLKMHDLTVLNSTAWTDLLINCSNVTVDNWKAIGYASTITETGNENDSFDILGGHDISFKHCFSYCHDDTYCIKTQKFSYSGEVRDVSYEDCIAWNIKSGNSFEIGYELGLNVTNVSYKDIYAIHSVGPGSNPLRRGALSIHNAAAGTVSHIRYENVYIEDPCEFGIYMMIAKSDYNIGDGIEYTTPGFIRDVYAKNIHMLKMPRQKNYLQAPKGHEGIDVTFEDLYIEGKRITGREDGKFSLYNCTPKFK